MSKHITRRKALATGAASAGVMIGTSTTPAQAAPLSGEGETSRLPRPKK